MSGGAGATRGVELLLGDPKRAIVRLAVPMVVAMSAQTLYNLADAVWVSGCGPQALSAVGFYFPFFFLGLALAVGVGIGAGSAIARRIGAEDKPGADAVATHGMIILAIAAALFAVPMLLFTRPIMATIGAGSALDDAVAYGRIMFAGSSLFFFNSFGGAVLRSEGDAKRSMLAMLAGAGLNILLDPLFIYVLDLGVTGAAWASLTAMSCVSLVMVRWLFLKRDTFVTFRFRGFRVRREILLDIGRVGAPATVSHASMFVMAFAITSIVARVGGADGVAVYTTGWRIVMFAILPILGIAGAVTTVTGAAFGAKDAVRLRVAYFHAIKISVAVEGGLALATLVGASWIARAFTWSAESARLGDDLVTFLRWIWLIYPATAFGMVSGHMFQGVGRGMTALTLTLIRTVAFNVPLAWLFGIVLDGGLVGVWTGMVVANVVWTGMVVAGTTTARGIDVRDCGGRTTGDCRSRAIGWGSGCQTGPGYHSPCSPGYHGTPMERSREPYLTKLREAHAAFAPEDVRLVSEVRTAIRMETDLLLHDRSANGLDEAQGLADVVDGVIAVHLATIAEPRGLVALALGGYGRGELSPFSDVDLMILVEESDEAARETAAGLVRFLWDVGYQVGHAVRTPPAATEAMERDIPSATALLESRFLWGDPALRRRLADEVVTPYLMSHREPYIEEKIREMRDRHRFYGGSPCIVEPNVKESPGGLRDMHVAQWIARARTGRRDFSELRSAGAVSSEALADVIGAYGTIHRVRHALHRLAEKRQDVLDAATQPAAAAALGFRDVEGRIGAEDLMRVYTGAARRVHQFLDEVVTFHEVGHRRTIRRPSLHRREIATGFVAVGDGLFLSRPDAFEGEGAARRMMRAFLLAQRHGLAVGEEIVIAIRRHAAAVGEQVRGDAEVIQAFRSVLQGRRGVARSLRDMHRAEVLGEILPEFADLTGLVRIDGYHRYTVDEHSLRTVEALEEFEGDTGDGFLRDELLRVLRPDLLRLAALLHDIGKASGPDHEAAGANRIVDVAKRMGFGEEETRILHDLIVHHTLLAEIADRRVLAEEEERVASAAGSAERLRMLMLLNVADVKAVGGEALSGLRLAQIRRLFEQVRDRLETLPGRTATGGGFEERLVAAAGPGRAAAAEVHAGLVPPRYRLEVDPTTAALHLELIDRLDGAAAAVRLVPGTVSGELWIVSRDRSARFAELAGALTASGLDVRSAEAYTRRDGVVLDVFHVADGAGEPVTDPAIAAEIEARLDGGDEGDLDAAVRSRTARFRVSGGSAAVAVKVRISNKVSPRHTVIDVVAADRPGLLYDLARCVAVHGLDIRFARIATRGERIVDAFYVTGPDGRVEDAEKLDDLRDALLDAARGSDEGTA